MLYNTTNGRAHNNISTTCCTTNSPPTDRNLPHPNILTCLVAACWALALRCGKFLRRNQLCAVGFTTRCNKVQSLQCTVMFQRQCSNAFKVWQDFIIASLQINCRACRLKILKIGRQTVDNHNVVFNLTVYLLIFNHSLNYPRFISTNYS